MRVITRRTLALTVVLALMGLTLSACGNRLPYNRVVAENIAAGGVRAAAQQALPPGSNGVATSSATTTTIAGTTAGGQTNGGGSSSSAAGTSAGTSASGAAGRQSAPAATTGAHCTGAPTGSTIAIGQIGTDSGIIGSLLGQARTGAQIWANYINSHGGLNCHPVNLITADDNGDPATAQSEVQTMVQQDHVLAFIENDNLLTTPNIAPYLQQQGVPVIGGTNIETTWYTNPDFYPQGGSLRVQIDGSVKAGIGQGKSQIGVIACVEFAAICANVTQFAQNDASALGGNFVYSTSVSIAQPDFTSECIAAKNAGANNLVMAMDPASDIRFANDCANQGFHPWLDTISEAFYGSSFINPNTLGTVAGGSVFPWLVQNAQTATFDQAVQAATGQAPNTEWDANAWVAGLTLEAAAANLPASNPTSAEIIAGLDTIKNDDFGGLTTPTTYTAGQPTPSPTCYFLMSVGQSSYEAPIGMNTQCLPASFSSVN